MRCRLLVHRRKNMAVETAEQLALYRRLITLQNGMRVLLRPLIPKDRDALVALFTTLPAEEISYFRSAVANLSLIHISEPTRLGMISYAVFCLNTNKQT